MSWDALVAAALLGTERRRPQPDGEGLLDAIDWSDPEGALLAGAAVLGTARAAGARPPQVPAPEPAPEDERPRCSPEADAVLARVLAEAPVLLREWLERTAAAGVCAHPRRLPELLFEATYDRGLRGPVLLACGRRGSWLAAQSPDWAWATKDPADHEDWETGSREERLAMLEAVRAQDPAAGRALVESTWDADSSDDRRAFLEVLAAGLSADDEPLLERALDSRKGTVRRQAARLLARLPESAFAGRMADRLAPLVSLSGKVRRRIEVEPPEAFDAGMARDGLRETRAPQGVGPRTWWLHQVARHAPLRVWTEQLGLPPARIVELLDDGLLWEVQSAAGDQADPEWTMALAERTGELPAGVPADVAGPAVRALARTARDLPALFRLADAAPGPWDAETSHAVLDAIDRAKVEPTHHWLRRRDVESFARRLDPGLLDRAAMALGRHDGTGLAPDAVGEALAVLDLRNAIMRELS